MFGRLASIVLQRYGLELRRRDDVGDDRASHAGILKNARRNGLNPNSIIDVGAAKGEFTRIAAQVFPGKACLMIEPLEEYADWLGALIREKREQMAWVKAAAAGKAGSAILNVHDDLFGSSFLRETEGPAVDGRPRTVRTVRVDDEVSSRQLKAPHLLKVDVQGGELAVLDGAAQSLEGADLVILEVSFFDFFQGGCSVVEVISYMAAKGFVPYDLTMPLYRPLDGSLAQIDVCFAPKSSGLRALHVYATPEQRSSQNTTMRAALERDAGSP